MNELEQAFDLLEKAIAKLRKRNCSQTALKKITDIRDAIDDALNEHDRGLEDFNGRTKEYDPD